MKYLITVEKPSVAKSFALALGAKAQNNDKGAFYYESDAYVIVAYFGHMLEQFEPDDYCDEWKQWEPKVYIPSEFKNRAIPASKKQLDLIVTLINREDIGTIINAGDAGREGELIQREVYQYSHNKKPVLRFWTSEELSKKVILQQLSKLEPSAKFDSLYEAGLARERSSWIFGYSATRIFTSLFGDKRYNILNAGNILTPTLCLVVRRELDIQNFKSEPFWNIHFKTSDGKLDAKAINPTHDKTKGDKHSFWDKEKVASILASCKGKSAIVTEITTERKKEFSPQLHNMPTLQEACSKLFDWSPADTLKIAQALYEKEVITYPRTDSRFLGESLRDDVQIKEKAISVSRCLNISSDVVDKMLPASKTGERIFSMKNLTDHHAIIPGAGEKMIEVFATLSDKERQCFSIVANQFVRAFLPPAIYDEMKCFLRCKDVEFIATQKKYVDKGWLEFEPFSKEGNDEELNLFKGQQIDGEVVSQERQTTPPERFTEGSLIKTMSHAHLYITNATDEQKEALKNAKGLGTGATRHQYPERLLEFKYLEKKNKFLVPTKKAFGFFELIKDNIISNVGFAAIQEFELLRIENGEKGATKEAFIDHSIKYANAILTSMLSKIDDAQGEGISKIDDAQKTIGICPKCNGNVKRRKKGYVCENFGSTCQLYVGFNALEALGHKNITEKEMKEILLNKNPMLTFISKKGIEYSKSVSLIEKDDRMQLHINFENSGEKSGGKSLSSSNNSPCIGRCPKCKNGEIKERDNFFACSDASCDYKIWKNSFKKFSGAQITALIAEELLKNSVVSLKFSPPTQRPYYGNIEIDLQYGAKFAKKERVVS